MTIEKCTCNDERQNSINEGVALLTKQKAPRFVIDDFILNMAHEQWTNCTCKGSHKNN